MFSHIRRVDIEFQSYCNRKCDWCPNTSLDRTFHQEMTDEMFLKIINELKEKNFGVPKITSQEALKLLPKRDLEQMRRDERSDLINSRPILSFLGYQEPFATPELFKRRVQQAADILPPTIDLVAHTNGDFLTKENLDKLFLTALKIMDYDNKGMDFWIQKFKDLGILLVNIDYDTEQIIGIHRYVGSVTCFCNWKNHSQLEDRGGFFKQGDLPEFAWHDDMRARNFPCSEPTYHMNFSYDGTMMPCCHMRQDNENHQPYILGNVANCSVSDILFSEETVALKKRLAMENGDYPDPCKFCRKTRSAFYHGDPDGIVFNGYKYTTDLLEDDQEEED